VRVLQCLVLTIVTLAGTRLASAQAVILGSSAIGRIGQTASLVQHSSRFTVERAPRFAVCEPSGGDCHGLHAYQIKMEVFPHWEFRVPLPVGFMLTNHNWTMEHDSVDLSLRQAMVGGTLRYQHRDDFWLELGGALAEQSVSHPVVSDVLASGDVGRMLPAVLGGVGGWIHLSAHADLDLRLRAGMSVGEDGGASVYHANLVLAFEWQ
jgi:hypothetical protein